MTPEPHPFLSLRDVSRDFSRDGRSYRAIENLSLSVSEGEFVAIVGPSGCGKSTLLRILQGLISPSTGEILYKGEHQDGINSDMAMVFQGFALLPWLSVRDNVALGLVARGRSKEVVDRTVSFYIDKVGLEGYEEAYPRELSGGMKQRVGLARALAIEPRILLMDEPFSNLDALTSVTLRDEVLMFWQDPEMPVRTIVMVTHIIEEALLMADRVVVLSRRPTRVVREIPVGLARPRNRKHPDFERLSDEIFSLIS
ncbi:MAG: ABC transporter ATP-binding protein [Leptospirales bacterium]